MFFFKNGNDQVPTAVAEDEDREMTPAQTETMKKANMTAWRADEGGGRLVTDALTDIEENGENQELWFGDMLLKGYLAGYHAATGTDGWNGYDDYKTWAEGNALYEKHINCANHENWDALAEMWEASFEAGYRKGLTKLPAWMAPPAN